MRKYKTKGHQLHFHNHKFIVFIEKHIAFRHLVQGCGMRFICPSIVQVLNFYYLCTNNKTIKP